MCCVVKGSVIGFIINRYIVYVVLVQFLRIQFCFGFVWSIIVSS